ncbi:MAG: class I SAM-dependent methyltransferase [Acidobacteriota bacterium]|nr:class I SAM-dependent methyltransferase [Acidobacteriota bacterium]
MPPESQPKSVPAQATGSAPGASSPPWDERYATPGEAFGEAPNDFLHQQEPLLRQRLGGGPARALCLGEGEGRNAVWLAGLGYDVTAVDLSRVGLANAHRLAARHGVLLTTVQADLATYELGESQWDLIVSIWCHLPPPLRQRVHGAVLQALRPGGLLVYVAYTPGQPARGTGGPGNPELCPSAAELRQDFAGLVWLVERDHVREIHEGRYHNGLSEVAELVGRRP